MKAWSHFRLRKSGRADYVERVISRSSTLPVKSLSLIAVGNFSMIQS